MLGVCQGCVWGSLPALGAAPHPQGAGAGAGGGARLWMGPAVISLLLALIKHPWHLAAAGPLPLMSWPEPSLPDCTVPLRLHIQVWKLPSFPLLNNAAQKVA